jgi:hypothetical protein
MKRPVVKSFTADRCARLTQVDSNLMCSARLQPALNKGVISEFFNGLHVSHGALTRAWLFAATPPAITPIVHQV